MPCVPPRSSILMLLELLRIGLPFAPLKEAYFSREPCCGIPVRVALPADPMSGLWPMGAGAETTESP